MRSTGEEWPTLFSDVLTPVSKLSRWLFFTLTIALVSTALVSFNVSAAQAAVPTAPTITSIGRSDQSLTVNFTAPAGVSPAIDNYEYSVDGGATWTAANPAVTSSPITITGLNNCQTYSVAVRAVNTDGPGATSELWNGVPGTLTYALDNGVMRFGSGTEASILPNGNLKQPWYKNSSGSWYKLTFSSNPLNYGLAVGGDGTNTWNYNGLAQYDLNLSRQTIDCSQFVTTSTSGTVAIGYGTLVTSGLWTFSNGQVVEVTRKYTQTSTSKYTAFSETIRNVGSSTLTNARLWVGTRDDWIGGTDGPTKRRGNISNGAFSLIPTANTQSKVLEISSGSDTVYFYTTSNLGYITGLNGYGDFATNVMAQNPDTTFIERTNDGSYAMYLRFQDIPPGSSESFNWYYLASSAADAASVLANVSSAALPGVPTVNSVTAGDSQVSVDFIEGTSGGSALTNYQYSTDGGATWQTRSPASLASPLVISGLSNGTSYDVQLRAVNSEGTSNPTTTTSATPIGTPQAPQITSLAQTDTSVTVSFNPPASDGGASVTGYEYSLDGGTTWVIPTTAITSSPFTIHDLLPGTPYQISLRAVNSEGQGAASSSQDVTTYTAPGAPTIGNVGVRDSSLSVEFTPGSSGGTPYTNIQYSIDGGATWVTRSPASTDSPLLIAGLVNGTAYPLALRTVNSVGHSSSSNVVSGTPATVPGAINFPSGTNVVPTNQSLTLSFTAPDNGGSAITSYEYSTDLGATWLGRTDSGGDSTTLVIHVLSSDGVTALTNGSTYQIQVRAVNAIGSGLASNDASGTPATVPSAPTITSVTSLDRALDLYFALGSNGGSAITGIEYCVLDCSTSSNWVTSSNLSSPLRISGLFNGISYTPQIRVVNAQGSSTEVTAAASVPSSSPTSPTIATLVMSAGQADITFQAPSSNGGLALTNYEYSVDEGANWTAVNPASLSTSLSITGLTNGTTYGFAIRAITASTTGMASAVVYGTPTTVPDAVSSPTLTPGSSRISVSFSAPNNGGSPITSYEYALSANGGAYSSWVSTNTSNTSFTITSLTNGTPYGVKIRAVNLIGAGAVYTTSSAVTPIGVPDSPVITSISNSQILSSLTDSQLSVNFTEPANNGSTITNYQYSTDGGLTWRNRTDTTGRLSPILVSKLSSDGVTDLSIDTAYNIKIRAVNANGIGDASTVTAARTGGAIDLIPPTVSVSRAAGDYSASRSLTFVATFSETVTGIQASDFVRDSGTANCTISGVSASSGTSVTVSVSCSTDGTFQLRMNANTISDGQNSGPVAAELSNAVTVNTVAPTATIQSMASTSSSRILIFPVSFNSPVSGIEYTDFTQTGGTASCSTTSASANSGVAVNFTVLCTTDGTVTMSLTAGSVTNSYFTAPVANVDSQLITIDSSVPTATIVSPSSRVSSPVLSYAVTFSESVSGIALTDFVQQAGTASCSTTAVSATSGTTVNFTVTCATDGTVQMRLLAGAISDGINAGPVSAVNSSYTTVDQLAPTARIVSPAVQSSSRQLSYTVEFSETVVGIAATDFVQSSGTALCTTTSASQAAGSSTTFIVTCSTDGTVTMKLSSNSVTDGLFTGPTVDVISREVSIDTTVPVIVTPPTARTPLRPGPITVQPITPPVTTREPVLINGVLPKVITAAPVVTVDGKVVAIQVEKFPTGGQQITMPSGASMSIDAPQESLVGSSGASSGVLQIRQGGNLVIEVSGLQPGSEVEVWLFSTPTFLGTVIVDADGKATGQFAVPADLHVGDHTAQLVGVDNTGTEMSVNTAVRISEDQVVAEDSVDSVVGSGSGIPWMLLVSLVVLFGILILIILLLRRRSRSEE